MTVLKNNFLTILEDDPGAQNIVRCYLENGASSKTQVAKMLQISEIQAETDFKRVIRKLRRKKGELDDIKVQGMGLRDDEDFE